MLADLLSLLGAMLIGAFLTILVLGWRRYGRRP